MESGARVTGVLEGGWEWVEEEELARDAEVPWEMLRQQWRSGKLRGILVCMCVYIYVNIHIYVRKIKGYFLECVLCIYICTHTYISIYIRDDNGIQKIKEYFCIYVCGHVCSCIYVYVHVKCM